MPETRRTFLRRGGGALASTIALPAGARWLMSANSALAASTIRRPDSLPDPTRPAGATTDALPFDHLIVVMMENHSFDNLLGTLSRSGKPRADGFTFDALGRVTNSNPDAAGNPVRAFPFPTTAQGDHVGQSWNSTHEQINGGRMDGFARYVDDPQPMGYWTKDVLPFIHSFAETFPVANRWFCSAPCQTYPNRRFLMAATAYGNISTDSSSFLDPPPPNGTIFDRLHAYGISWRNYFTDLPATGIIPSTIEKYPANIVPIARFFADLKAGTLPAVSFVDPEFGALGEVGGPLSQVPGMAQLGAKLSATGGDEENPQDMKYGEAWAHDVVNAILQSPAWPRTLLVYTYDEHGGYYDHVPPPKTLAPDDIPPKLAPGDVKGGYRQLGPRVPAIVASPYAKKGVTNVVHDHTSVLATIEAKWNLPALTYRDANAETVMDFLDVSRARFLDPPVIAGPPLAGVVA